jgi:hypothetical protein
MVSFTLLLIATTISTFVILLSVNLTSAQTEHQLNLSVSTDDAAYLPKDNIKISGSVYDGGNPLNKYPVNITVFLSDDPSKIGGYLRYLYDIWRDEPESKERRSSKEQNLEDSPEGKENRRLFYKGVKNLALIIMSPLTRDSCLVYSFSRWNY